MARPHRRAPGSASAARPDEAARGTRPVQRDPGPGARHGRSRADARIRVVPLRHPCVAVRYGGAHVVADRGPDSRSAYVAALSADGLPLPPVAGADDAGVVPHAG